MNNKIFAILGISFPFILTSCTNAPLTPRSVEPGSSSEQTSESDITTSTSIDHTTVIPSTTIDSSTIESTSTSEEEPVSFHYSITYVETNINKRDCIGEYTYTVGVNTKQEVFDEMMRDCEEFELTNNINDLTYNIDRRYSPKSVSDIVEENIAFAVSYSPKTITVNVYFQSADTSLVFLGDSTEYTESTYSGDSICNFVWKTIDEFEVENDVLVNTAGAPNDGEDCLYCSRDYTFVYQEVNEDLQYYNITYQVIELGLKSPRGGRPVLHEFDVTPDATILGPSLVAQGSSFSFEAFFDKEDRVFAYWKSSSAIYPISSTSLCEYTPNQDVTVTAYFAINTEERAYFEVFANSDFEFEEEYRGYVEPGTEVSIFATYNPRAKGHEFKGWRDLFTDEIVSTDINYTFVMPSRPYILLAKTGRK